MIAKTLSLCAYISTAMTSKHFHERVVVRSYACEDCGRCTSLLPIQPARNFRLSRTAPDKNIMYFLGEKHITCTKCVVQCPVCMIPVSCARKEMCQICTCCPVHVCDVEVGRIQDYPREKDTDTWFISNDEHTYYPTSPLYHPSDA
jgi:hypothetical protein